MPWRALRSHSEELGTHGEPVTDVTFVDVDLPEVMQAKRATVEQTPALCAPLTNLAFSRDLPLVLHSDQYCQIACSLHDVDALRAGLSRALAASSKDHDDATAVTNDNNDENDDFARGRAFLFVADTSTASLDVAAVDALIRWTGTLGTTAEFCLLEPLLPGGSGHPFADTLLRQFSQAQMPLTCVCHYPTAAAQRKRFLDLDWTCARVWTLWEAWADAVFFSPADRQQLDTVEPFDDWEELASFASHHCLIYARNGGPLPEEFAVASDGAASMNTTSDDTSLPPPAPVALMSATLMASAMAAGSKPAPSRRFGAALVVKDVLGRRSVAHVFGAGNEGPLRSCDLYNCSSGGDGTADVDAGMRDEPLIPAGLHEGGPAARSCFTVTDFGDAGYYLLVGGRSSPAAPFRDCWQFRKDMGLWDRTHDLPVPLFRHAAVRLGETQLALVAGGRPGPAAVSPNYLVYHPTAGWLQCAVQSDDGAVQPPPVFGALLLLQDSGTGASSVFRGLLAGGMTADGVVSETVADWILDVTVVTAPKIRFFACSTRPREITTLLARFGAVSTCVYDGKDNVLGGATVIAGGVTRQAGSVLGDAEIVRFHSSMDGTCGTDTIECLAYVSHLGPDVSRPILVGASVVATHHPGEVVIVGGGVASTVTGTAWSRGAYSLVFDGSRDAGDTSGDNTASGRWRYARTLAVANAAPQDDLDDCHGTNRHPLITAIPRMPLTSDKEFRAVLQRGQPVVFTGLDLGRCVAKWTMAYLAEQVGPERKVVVHEASEQAMNFVAKNFQYRTQTFDALVQDVERGRKVYLRALSADRPSDAPARLDADFPALARDFVLPPALAHAQEKLFSSVLRVSGPVDMWLHYDVLANVYCQVRGSKRFLLFPPTDATRLGFAPGASSSSIDVFSALASSTLAPSCRPHEATVGPGDVLLLPQLWLHTATPVMPETAPMIPPTPTMPGSVAVNVFFRDLEGGYAHGRDVYGNRDLAAYERARHDVAKMASAFRDLPRDTRDFYLRRVADELLQLATE